MCYAFGGLAAGLREWDGCFRRTCWTYHESHRSCIAILLFLLDPRRILTRLCSDRCTVDVHLITLLLLPPPANFPSSVPPALEFIPLPNPLFLFHFPASLHPLPLFLLPLALQFHILDVARARPPDGLENLARGQLFFLACVPGAVGQFCSFEVGVVGVDEFFAFGRVMLCAQLPLEFE